MSGETKQRISDLEAEIARLKAAQPTLRDQFAMAALTGLLSYSNSGTVTDTVNTAYYIAHSMMEARNDE
ncbi:MAG: hypothetical protein EB015_07400 [Methylocystaceae bacterium]|nr:hypothetical protein [Methylocystaceae bacterium]